MTTLATIPATVTQASSEDITWGNDVSAQLVNGQTVTLPVVTITDLSVRGQPQLGFTYGPSVTGNVISQRIPDGMLTALHNYRLVWGFTPSGTTDIRESATGVICPFGPVGSCPPAPRVGFLESANNLSDVSDIVTAVANLGLGGLVSGVATNAAAIAAETARAETAEASLLPASTERTIYVSRGSQANDANSGLTWASPLATLQAALAVASAGAEIRMGIGTWEFTTPSLTQFMCVLTATNIKIRGLGRGLTVLQIGAAIGNYYGLIGNEISTVDLTGFELSDLTIDQNWQNNPVSDPMFASGALRILVGIQKGTKVKVTNVEFTNVEGVWAISGNFSQHNSADDWIIDGCWFTNVGNAGGALWFDNSTIYVFGDRTTIVHNHFYGASYGIAVPALGTGGLGATTAIETHGSTQEVSGNFVYGYQTVGNATGETVATQLRSFGINWHDNVARQVASGIQLWSDSTSGNTDTVGLEAVNIHDNDLEIDITHWLSQENAPRVAVGLADTVGTYMPIRAIKVHDNTIRYVGLTNYTGVLSAGCPIGTTALNGTGFAALPIVTGTTNELQLLINAGAGDAETVLITAHAAASTAVTVGATANAHFSAEPWSVVPLTPNEVQNGQSIRFVRSSAVAVTNPNGGATFGADYDIDIVRNRISGCPAGDVYVALNNANGLFGLTLDNAGRNVGAGSGTVFGSTKRTGCRVVGLCFNATIAHKSEDDQVAHSLDLGIDLTGLTSIGAPTNTVATMVNLTPVYTYDDVTVQSIAVGSASEVMCTGTVWNIGLVPSGTGYYAGSQVNDLLRSLTLQQVTTPTGGTWEPVPNPGTGAKGYSAVVVATSNITLSSSQTIDGVAVSTQRILCVGQTIQSQNGLWNAKSSGAWTRPLDCNTGMIVDGATSTIRSGTVGAGLIFVLEGSSVIVDTSSQTWAVQKAAPFGIVRTPWSSIPNGSLAIGFANSAVYLRVLEGGTISKIRVTVTVSSGNVDVGAYQNTGSGLSAAPGTQYAHAGSTACPTAGTTDISLGSSITMQAGDWIALACDNTTATFAGFSALSEATLGDGTSYNQASAFPLPGTATPVAANNRLPSILGVP